MIAFRVLLLIMLASLPVAAADLPKGSVVAAGVVDHGTAQTRCDLPAEVEINGDNHTGVVWFGPCSFLLYHFVVFNGDPYHCEGWGTGCGGRCDVAPDRSVLCRALSQWTHQEVTRLTLAPDGAFAFSDASDGSEITAHGRLVRSV